MDSEQSQNNETLNMNDDDNEESQQDWSTISGTPPLIVAEEPDEEEHIPESSTPPPQLDPMEQMEDLPVNACKEEPTDETSATPAPIEPPQIVIEALQKAEDGINAVEEKPPVLVEQSQSTNKEVDENREIVSHVEGSKARATPQKLKTNLLTVCRRELENSTSDSEADTGKSSQNLPTQRSSSEEPVRRLKSPNLPQRTNFVKFVSASLEKKVESDSNAPHGNQTSQESSKDEAIISTPKVSLNENVKIQEESVASALQETPPISSSTPEPVIGKAPNVPTVKPGFSIFVDSPVSRKKQMERGNSFDRSSEKKTPVSSPIEMPNQFKYSPIIQNPETSPVWGSKFVQNPSPVELPRPTRPPIDRPSRLSSQLSDSPAKSSPISKPSPISRSSFRRSDEQKSGRKSSATPKNGSRFRYYNAPKRESSSNSSKENAKLSREEREDIQKKKARRKTRLDAAVKKQELEFPWRELDGPADPDDPNFTMKDLPRWGWGWVRYKYRRNSSTQILNQHVDLIPSRCVLYRADDRQQAIVAQHEMNRRFYTNKDNKKSPSLCRYETQRQQAPLVARMLSKARDETQIYSFMHLEKTQRDDMISNMDNGTDGVHSSSALEVKPLKFSKNDFAGLGKMDFVKLFACILCARIMKNPVCCFPCMHRFCFECMQKRVERHNYRCPRCNSKLYTDQPAKSDPRLQRLIESFNFNMNTRYYLPQPHEISSDEEELEEIFDLYGYTEEEKQAYLSASNQLPFPKIPKCDANFWRNCYERNGTMWNKEDSEPEDIPWKSVVSAVPLIDAQQMVPPDYELGHLTPSQRLRAYAHDYKKFQCNRRHMWPIVRRPDDAFWKRFFIRRKLERITGRVKHSSDEDLNESDLSDMDRDANELNKCDREVKNKACQYSDDEYKPFKWPPSVNPNVRRPYRRRRPFSVLSESRVTSRASEQQNDGKKQLLQISSDFMDEETEHSNLEAPPLLAYSDHLSGLDREGNDTPNSTTSGGDAGTVRRSTRPRKMTARAQRFRDTTTPKSNASGDGEYLNQPTKSRKRAKELQPTSGRNTADGGIGSGGQLKLATHRRSKRVVPKRYNQDEWAQELSDEDDGNDTEEADEDMRRAVRNQTPSTVTSESECNTIDFNANENEQIFAKRSKENLLLAEWRKKTCISFGPKFSFVSFGEMMLPTFGIPPLVLRPNRSSSTKYIEANELIPFFIRAPDDATVLHLILYMDKRLSEVYGVKRNSLDISLLEVKWQCKADKISILRYQKNVNGRGNNMLSWSGGKQICIPSNNEDDMFDDRSPVLMKMKATGLNEQGQMDAAGNIYVPNVQTNDSSGVQPDERAMPENLMDAVRLGDGSLEDTNARKGLMEELFRAKKRGRPSRVELEARKLKIQRYIEEHIIKNTDILKRSADCMKPFDEGLDGLGASADSSSMMDAKRSRMETDPGSSQYNPLPPVSLKPQNLPTSAASSSSVSVNPQPSNQNSSSGNLKSPIASPERVEKAQELKQSQSSESLGSKSPPKSSPSKRSSKAGREEEISDSERGDRKTTRGKGRAKRMSTAEESESEEKEEEETTPQKKAGRKRTRRDSSEEYSDEGTIKRTRPQRAKRANKSFKEESDESDEPRSPITRGRKISQDRKRISTNQEITEEASTKNDEKHMKDKASASVMPQLPASAVPPSLVLESSMERKNSSDASPPKLIAQSSGEATDNSDEMPVLQRMEPTPTESVSQPRPKLVQQQQQTSQPNVSQSPSTALIQQQCGVIQPYSTPTFLFQAAPDKMSTYQFLPGPDGTFQDYYPSPGSSIGPIDVHLQSISSGMQKIVKALPFRFENSNKQSFFRFAVPIEELQSPSNQFAVISNEQGNQLSTSQQGIMSPSNNVNFGSSTSQLNTPPSKTPITITLVDGAKSVKEVLRDRVQMKQFNPRTSSSSKLKQHERSNMPASAWIATFHPEFTPVLFGQTSSLQQSTDPDQNAFSPLPSSFEKTSISGKSKAKFALSVKTTSKNDDIYSFEFPHVALPFDLTLGELRARRPDKTTFLSIFYSIRDKNVEDLP